MSPYREMKLMAEASESNRLDTQAKLDRVTAERDALQQRLTAADEQIDGLRTELAAVRLGPCKMIVGDELP